MALVIKLDSSVTDETLPKIGEVFFDVNISHNFTFGFLTNEKVSFTARIIGDGNFFTDANYTTSAGTEVTQTTSNLYLSAGSYKLGITSKYAVKSIGVDLPLLADLGAISLDCSQLKYSQYTFSLLASHWELTNFSAENMSKCSVISAGGASSLIFDVAEFKNMPSLNEINVSNTGAYGDLVAAVGDKINMTRLIASSTTCTGTYSEIADAMFAAGRTSGTMVILVADGAGIKTITFTTSGWTAA